MIGKRQFKFLNDLDVQGQQGLSLARWREPLHSIPGECQPDDLRAEGESLRRGTIFLPGAERHDHPRRRYHTRRSRLVFSCQDNTRLSNAFSNTVDSPLDVTKDIATTLASRSRRSVGYTGEKSCFTAWQSHLENKRRGREDVKRYEETANANVNKEWGKRIDGRRVVQLCSFPVALLKDLFSPSIGESEKSGGYTGKPLPTYRPASQLVPLGGAARLFCEAYLGKVELPDAKNSVTWSKSDSNVTLPSHGRIAQHRVSSDLCVEYFDTVVPTLTSIFIFSETTKNQREYEDEDKEFGERERDEDKEKPRQEITSRSEQLDSVGMNIKTLRLIAMDKSKLEERRENNQIIGSYLEIEDITLEDYGEYKCEVSNGVDEEITLPAHVYRQATVRAGSTKRILEEIVPGGRVGAASADLGRGVLRALLATPGAALPRQIRPPRGECEPQCIRARNDWALMHWAGWTAIDAVWLTHDGKECDALVCYHEKDSSLVIGIIIPTLESRHRYKCTALELSQLNQNSHTEPFLSPAFSITEVIIETQQSRVARVIVANVQIGKIKKNIIASFVRVLCDFEGRGAEIGSHAVSSRRVIMILSPASLGNVWNETNVGTVLNQLSSLTVPIIVIATKDLSNTSTIAKRSNRGCNDSSEFSLDRLKILHWNENHGTSGFGSQKFWYKLRLAMPPVRPISSESGCQSVAMIVQANGKCGQQKARSRESLEVLV
ncbi:hypothetical protein WN51_09144 [Melipona quadrifasciata]|uniref:Soluble interferon alpha/beta receptor OPG204 n=1 Tax=Melipona quadrifasciata TaxID=166423 RepID=A0A0N0BJM5_9HYME|nr:hypothetical protein WN51_09144 [Melipona quadrifasciata]